MFDGGANKDKEFAGYEPEAPLAQRHSIPFFLSKELHSNRFARHHSRTRRKPAELTSFL